MKLENQISASEIYSNACQASLSYSNALLTVRTSALAQGVTLVSASAFLAKEGEHLLALGSSFFGCFLTLILLFLQGHYLRHSRRINDFLPTLEAEASQLGSGGWSDLKLMRDSSPNQPLRRFMLNSALYWLIFLSHVIVNFIPSKPV